MKTSYVQLWVTGWFLMFRAMLAMLMLSIALAPTILVSEVISAIEERSSTTVLILLNIAYTCTIAPILLYWLAHKIGFPLGIESEQANKESAS